MEDTRVPISDEAMIDQMVTHFALAGVVTLSRQKWDEYIEENPEKENWKDAKTWHRRKYRAVKEAEEDTGMEGGSAFAAHKRKAATDLGREKQEKRSAKTSMTK